MHKNIAVILGDGIGPEVTRQSVKVLTAIARQFNHQFNFSYGLMGAGALEKTGTFLPAETLNMCRNSDAVLFGALNFPQSDSIPSTLAVDVQGLAEIGKELGLFARICPITSYASLQHLSPLKSNRLENIDFVIFQEESGQNIGSNQHNVGTISENSNEYDYYKKEIKRIAHLAFAFTQKRRKQVTLINTSHASQTSQLWRKVVEEILVEYKDVSINYMVLENAVARIIQNPKQLDVILTDNISGNIINNAAGVITGLPGLLPYASVGNEATLFGSVLNNYPQAAGKNVANPVGSLLSTAMMLDYFALPKEAELVREGVEWTLMNGFFTKDIDPINNYSTSTIGELITDYVENRIPSKINKENMVLSKSTII